VSEGGGDRGAWWGTGGRGGEGRTVELVLAGRVCTQGHTVKGSSEYLRNDIWTQAQRMCPEPPPPPEG